MSPAGILALVVGGLIGLIGVLGFLYYGFYRGEIGEKRVYIYFAIATVGYIIWAIGERILGYSLLLQIANNIGR